MGPIFFLIIKTQFIWTLLFPSLNLKDAYISWFTNPDILNNPLAVKVELDQNK